MARSDYEESIDRGQSVELYQFIYGDAGQSYYYTDGEAAIVFDENTYAPAAISRDKIEVTKELVRTELKIEVPRDSNVAGLFLIYPPGRVVSVIIRQGHLANPDDPVEFTTGEQFPVIWSGRVLEASRGGLYSTLGCEASAAGLRKPGLRRHYQWPCPLVLYQSACGATKTAINAAVVSITGNKITLPAAWFGTNTAKDFIGGLVEWTVDAGKESRGILRVENDVTIVISGPPIGLEVTDTLSVFVGCPHTLAGCEELHNNVVNYGGHPWIPYEGNPVGKNNHM